MGTGTFRASVQYGNLKGSCAADRADTSNFESWLVENAQLSDGESLAGVSMWTGENDGEHTDPIYVTALVTARGWDDGVRSPVVLRKISLQMPLVQFFGFFKRLSFTLSPEGHLEGKEYRYPE